MGHILNKHPGLEAPLRALEACGKEGQRREEDKRPALFHVLEPSASPRMSRTNNPSPEGRSKLFSPLNEINDTITQLVSLQYGLAIAESQSERLR